MQPAWVLRSSCTSLAVTSRRKSQFALFGAMCTNTASCSRAIAISKCITGCSSIMLHCGMGKRVLCASFLKQCHAS